MIFKKAVLFFCFLVLWSAGCGAQQLKGTSFNSEHYQVFTDHDDQAFAKNIGLEAERCHRTLSEYFAATGKASSCRIQIATEYKHYKALRKKEISAGEFHAGFMITPTIIVSWRSTMRGREILSHEMVHFFVEEYMPEIADWKNEGLALALEGSANPLEHELLQDIDTSSKAIQVRYWPARDHNIAGLRTLGKDELKSVFERIQTFDKLSSGRKERNMIALIVRFGLETQNWVSLRALEHWEPDFVAFRRWLLKQDPLRSRNFKPLLSTGLGPDVFGPRTIKFRRPKLNGHSYQSKQFRIYSDSENKRFLKRIARLAEFYKTTFEKYCGLTTSQLPPLTIYLYSDVQAFSKQRRGTNHHWEFLPTVQKDAVLMRWDQLQSTRDDYSSARFAEMILAYLAHHLLGDHPAWFRAGLSCALNHSKNYASQNPFRCPVTTSSRSLKDAIYQREIAQLQGLPESAFERGQVRRFAGLIVRFGLETAGWKNLPDAKDWEPESAAFIKWLRGLSQNDYHEHHQKFKPLPEVKGLKIDKN
jgi:hypothetical protein